MKVYMVRHTSVDVPPGVAYGQTDVNVRDTFEMEAQAVKEKLAHIPFVKVWCSPLSRCVRLAEYCGFPDALRDDRLKEHHFGEWEMRSYDDLLATDPRYIDWCANWLDYRIPGGESFAGLCRRVAGFLDEIRRETADGYGNVAVFAHAGVIAAFYVYAGKYTMEEAFNHPVGYGEVVTLSFSS
ncbi:MAG: alpha-ribazole phosphatase [Tannerellaceae bacterium]|nr:alpha-ribazole phosphatase [Tannerellaceae bacterium]